MVGRSTLAREAANWDARLRSPDCTPAERLAYAAWREVPGASEQMARLTQALELLGQHTPIGKAPRLSPVQWVRRHSAGSGFAAGAAIVAALAFVRTDDPSMRQAFAATTTARSVRLADGSTVDLFPGSSIDVTIAAKARRVDLRAGRAHFLVAKNVGRSFVVRAADRTVTAVGTEFEASIAAGHVRVGLKRGTVRIWCWHGLLPSEMTLRPGQTLDAEIGSDRARLS